MVFVMPFAGWLSQRFSTKQKSPSRNSAFLRCSLRRTPPPRPPPKSGKDNSFESSAFFLLFAHLPFSLLSEGFWFLTCLVESTRPGITPLETVSSHGKSLVSVSREARGGRNFKIEVFCGH